MKTKYNCPTCKHYLISDEDETELYCPDCNKSTEYWNFVICPKEARFS